MRRTYNIFANLLAVIFGFLIAFLLLEVLVLLFVGEVPKFPRHVVEAPWGLRYNEPGAHYRHKSADGIWYFRINDQGMRADRNYSHEKPPGVKRILNLGDSFTLGFEVQNEQTYSSVLQRELSAAGMNVEVLNAGVSGFSNAEACIYLERELLRYEPDLVVVSYWYNDPQDNVRSGLFRLEGDSLVLWHEKYVPMGQLANFLNTNWLFTKLSERSNGLVVLKSLINAVIKQRMVKRNESSLWHLAIGSANTDGNGQLNLGESVKDMTNYRQRLAAAIFERVYKILQNRGIQLIIQSIPTPSEDRKNLIEEFPLSYFDVSRPHIMFLSQKEVLEPFVGKELLYRRRSQTHWTPYSHEQAGKAIPKLILEHKLLQCPPN